MSFNLLDSAIDLHSGKMYKESKHSSILIYIYMIYMYNIFPTLRILRHQRLQMHSKQKRDQREDKTRN